MSTCIMVRRHCQHNHLADAGAVTDSAPRLSSSVDTEASYIGHLESLSAKFIFYFWFWWDEREIMVAKAFEYRRISLNLGQNSAA